MFKKTLLFTLTLFLLIGCAAAEDIHGYDKKQGGYCYVTFGSYPTEKNGEEAPLLWRVLEVEGNEAYLLTEYIVDAHCVHPDAKAYDKMKWEESALFSYLQTDFMSRAFSEGEQAALLQRTEDGGLVSLPQVDDIRNAAYGFVDNASRECSGTPYAKAIGLYMYNDLNSPWATRNKSQDRPQNQRRVMDEGKMGTVSCVNDDTGIRPCVYVNLSMLAINSGSGTMDDPYQLVSTATPSFTAPTTPVPTALPVVENDNDGDALSALIEQMAVEQETAPDAAPATPAPVEVPAADDVPAVPVPQATPASIGGIVYQTDTGVVITSLDAITPAPLATQAPETTEVSALDDVQDDEVVPDTVEVLPTAAPENNADVFTAGANPEYIHASFPELTSEGFLPEGQAEFVLEDEENGLWLYADRQLRIQIERKTGQNSKKQALRWFEARIFTRDNTELFDLYPWDAENYKNHYKLTLADEIALQHKLVFAINSDYFIYREARQHDKDVNYNYPKGLVIRDGEVFYDVPRKSNSTVYPPLDLMAFYPDGSMQVYLNGSMTADEMLATGATDTLAFGPILVEDGQLSPRSKEFGNTPNPRTAFGYVEPGHYVCVVVESRTSESKGESCVWMGEKMFELGCESAINLDGGATSTMIFMGKQINKSGNYGDITNRKQNELIGIGYSENVGK